MKLPKVSLPPLPDVQRFRFPTFQGVNDRMDPTRTPEGFLHAADNLRFDRAVPQVRTGFTAVYNDTSIFDTAPTGMAAWRGTYDSARHQQFLFTSTKSGSTDKLFVATDGGAPVVVSGTSLTATGADTYFDRLDSVVYGVNGKDGLFSWGGQSFTKWVPLADPPTVSDSGSPSRFTSNTISWASTDAGLTVATDTTHFGILYHHAPLYTMAWTPATPLTARAIFDLGAAGVMNLLLPQNNSATLTLDMQYTSAVPEDPTLHSLVLRVILVHASADPTGVYNDGLMYSWDVSYTNQDDWHVFNLPLDAVPPTIKESARYLVFEVSSVAFANPVLGFKLNWGSAYLPGFVDGGTRYYKIQQRRADDATVAAYNEFLAGNATPQDLATIEAGIFSDLETSNASTPFAVQMYEWATGPVTASEAAQQAPYQRVKIPIDRNSLDPNATFIDLYRAVQDPAITDPAEMEYYLVYSDFAHGANRNIFLYDFVSDALLVGADRAFPGHRTPPSPNDDAPKFLISTGTRMVYGSTNNFPARIWLSDIGDAPSVPNVSVLDLDPAVDIGRGAFADVGRDFTDPIMGFSSRLEETLIFKKHGVWSLNIRAEGGPDEQWNINQLQRAPGCISSRSICRIPTGVVWMSYDGLYYLADGQVIALPITLDIQGTIDAIPQGLRASVVCTYHERDRLLFVSLAEAGQGANNVLAVLDLRFQQLGNPLMGSIGLLGHWAGKWRIKDATGAAVFPHLLFVDVDDSLNHWLYVAHAASARIDRQLHLSEADAWKDYGTEPITFQMTTGYQEPIPGRRMRLVGRRLEFITDGTGGGVQSISNVALTLRTRPSGNPPGTLPQHTYLYPTLDLSLETEGLRSYALTAQTGVHTDLEGQQFQAVLSGDVLAAEPVRIGLFEVDAIDKGRVSP